MHVHSSACTTYLSAMATTSSLRSHCLSTAFVFFVIALSLLIFQAMTASAHAANDSDLLQFNMNSEYLAAEFFLFGALGKGLDDIDPALALGGPPPIGGRKANLEPPFAPIIEEFGYQQVGHLRAIINATGGIPRPLINISTLIFSIFVQLAVPFPLIPPFDVYANSVNYLLGCYAITYDGLAALVGTVPNLTLPDARQLGTKLVGVKAGQNAVVRALLYERANETVFPYSLTVAQLAERITAIGNKLGRNGIKEEGLIVPLELGAENRTTSNVLSLDVDSLSYARSPREFLRILYGTGNEKLPGGFFPKGANGEIATTCVVV